MDKLLTASEKTSAMLAGQLTKQGTLAEPDVADDLAAVYKLPALMAASGRTAEAHRLLDFIKSKYMQVYTQTCSLCRMLTPTKMCLPLLSGQDL